MVSSALSKTVYVIITLIITVMLVAFTWVEVEGVRERMLLQKRQDLLDITSALERKLPASYDELLHQAGAFSASDKEKCQVLHSILQPVVEELAQEWPDYLLVYYSREWGYLAMSPLRPHLIGTYAIPAILKAYKNSKPELVHIDDQFFLTGKPVVVLPNIIVRNGQIVGHASASIRLSDIEDALYRHLVNNIGIAFMVWMLAVSVVYLSFQRQRLSLVNIAQIVRNDNFDDRVINKNPELREVFETIRTLRADLKAEYEGKDNLRQELARLERLNIIGEMAAGVAHEIRNPMTVITGYLQMMQVRPEKISQEKIEMILEEMGRVNGILSDFLSLARNKQVDKVPTELGGLVEELEPFIMAECNKRGIQYRAYLSDGLPKIVADRKEIKQLILNLVCNAVEAMGQHGELAIFTTVAEQGARLVVADTGYGISSEQVEKIFNPFFTTKADGTGLGLAVCKSIVDRHNGSIAVMSEPGRGTRVITTFPAMSDLDLGGDLQQDIN